MSLVANRVGIEEFQHKVDRMFRNDVLQRPARPLTAFRWYNGRFRVFARDQHKAVQRRMVQLYVAEGVGRGSMAEDVADQYKQLIRVQDEKFREVQKENEGLRAEVEAFMRRSLQASSAALVGKMDSLRMENEALHAEVAQLEQESTERSTRLEQELQRSRSYILELEQQRQSMAVGYEQVERTSEALRAEVNSLKVAVAVAKAAQPGTKDASREAITKEAEEARQRVEELKGERADLLDLLGCVIAACPEASKFVAPLGLSEVLSESGAPRAGGTAARDSRPGS